MFLYVPNKLINAKNKIVQTHKATAEVTIDEHDDSLKELILRLAELPEENLEREAYALSDTDIQLVAAYIPGNCFNIELDKLFTIYTYRANKKNFSILYDRWQDYYANNACNTFIVGLLFEDEENSNTIIEEPLKTDLRSILFKGEVIPAFEEYIKKQREKSDASLDEVLERWKLRSESKLTWELKFLFYTYCNVKDYLEISKEELMSFVKQYAYKKDILLKKFLLNFVTKLKLSQLEKYSTIGKFLSSYTELPGTTKFGEFFTGVPLNVVNKYVDWINRITLDEVFGYDERSMFWRDYRFRSVKKYPRSNSVVMEMDEYYATEFLGKAMGPIYFYDKDTFENKIRGWFKYKDNKEIRSTLYSHLELCLAREEHKKPYGNEFYWQGQVRGLLRANNMTSLIKDY